MASRRRGGGVCVSRRWSVGGGWRWRGSWLLGAGCGSGGLVHRGEFSTGLVIGSGTRPGGDAGSGQGGFDDAEVNPMARWLWIMSAHRLVALLAGLLAMTPTALCQAQTTDLVVYGGTASGVMTAYAAAREGLHVVLLVPGSHVGGMVTGGLSATGLGDFAIIGGYARQFYLKAAAHYGVRDLNAKEHWLSEPHVDEAIFDQMLRDAGVVVRLHERLREHDGVEKDGRRIVALTTEDGKRWTGKVFADCSYEGDVMEGAGGRGEVGRAAGGA